MLCPFCKEEIVDGALKCKHCASMLASPVEQLETKTGPQETGTGASAGYATIDALDMSEALKNKMCFVHDNIKGTKFGMPDYGLVGKAVWSSFSLWAFFFSCFYYFAKGLWGKGLVLLGVNIGLSIICDLLGLPGAIVVIVTAVVAMQSAYYDIYRRKVLKQSFWW